MHVVVLNTDAVMEESVVAKVPVDAAADIVDLVVLDDKVIETIARQWTEMDTCVADDVGDRQRVIGCDLEPAHFAVSYLYTHHVARSTRQVREDDAATVATNELSARHCKRHRRTDRDHARDVDDAA